MFYRVLSSGTRLTLNSSRGRASRNLVVRPNGATGLLLDTNRLRRGSSFDDPVGVHGDEPASFMLRVRSSGDMGTAPQRSVR
jgi:hypothetical protein